MNSNFSKAKAHANRAAIGETDPFYHFVNPKITSRIANTNPTRLGIRTEKLPLLGMKTPINPKTTDSANDSKYADTMMIGPQSIPAPGTPEVLFPIWSVAIRSPQTAQKEHDMTPQIMLIMLRHGRDRCLGVS